MRLKMKKILVVTISLFSTIALAQENSSLEKKLDELSIPDNKVTNVLSEDKLYIVNTRYSSLVNRHEFTLLGANNFTADSHLSTAHVGASYRYHINSTWSLGLRYNRYSNKLTPSGERLFSEQRMLPDTDYAFNSSEIFANYNTIYGKLRITDDTLVYFDQYISLGAGKIKLASGEQNHGFADLGLSFWLGNHISTRIGVKNEFYTQKKVTGNKNVHNAFGYFELGYLFGKGDRE